MASLRAVLGRYTEQTYALMRIVVPFLYLCHGAQKLSGCWVAARSGAARRSSSRPG